MNKQRFHRIPLRIDVEEVGASLAHGEADTQAAMLTAFCKELRSCCGSRHAAEMQLAYVADELSRDDCDLLAMLGYRE